MANNVEKKKFRIQQLILAVNDNEFPPITINDESGRWTSNGSSLPTPFDSGTNDEFPITINDAIGNAYAEDERTQEIFNALNTNQRTLKKIFLSKASVLRPQSQTRKVCRERLPKFAFGSLGKRSRNVGNVQHIGNVGNVPGRVRRS